MKILKFIGILMISIILIVIYYYSFLWISALLLLGFLYQPIMNTSFEQIISFEIFVLIINTSLLALIIVKIKRNEYLFLVFQSIGILLLSFPLILSFFYHFKSQEMESGNGKLAVIISAITTLIFVSYNYLKKENEKNK